MENKYQSKFGSPVERTKGKVRPTIAPWIQEFIRHSPFCVMATSNAEGQCDASPKGGTPGFVKILNDKQLFIPDVAGNKLFHGYVNIESNPRVGLVFFIPGHNNTVRVNGLVTVVDRSELKRHQTGSLRRRREGGSAPGLAAERRGVLQPLPARFKVFPALGRRGNCEKYCTTASRPQRAGNLAECGFSEYWSGGVLEQ